MSSAKWRPFSVELNVLARKEIKEIVYPSTDIGGVLNYIINLNNVEYRHG